LKRCGEISVSGRAEEYPFEVGCAWISGWDFTVVLDDALAGGPVEELDELRGYLAASERIAEILHEDREVMHLRADDLKLSEVEKKVRKAVEQTSIDG
jgi:hypothetical protein